MLRKCLQPIKRSSVVGAANAVVPSERTEPDLHLFGEDTSSMSGGDSSRNVQPSFSSASEKKI